jgi:hypothetical protein
MNAVALKAESQVKAYLATLTWGDVTPTVLMSTDRGAQSFASAEEMDTMPAFPYIVVACESSTQDHPHIDVHECRIAVDLRTSADDELGSEMFALLQVMEAGLQALTYNDGWQELNADAEESAPGFDCQYAIPGDYGGARVEDRARVFSRSINLWGRTMMPA